MPFTLSFSRTRTLVALALLAAALIPSASSARPDQEGARERRTDVRHRRGEVRLEVNLLDARSNEVTDALRSIEANVSTQRAELQEAERAAAAAVVDLAEAEVAVGEAQHRVDNLNARSDEFVVEAYVNPPAEDAFDALSAESLSDATLKHAIMDMQADNDADVLDHLAEAHQDLQFQREEKAAVAAETERKRGDARREFEELEAARAQQAKFAAQAEDALERKLAESAHLAELDAQLSRQIAAEEAALAARMGASGAPGSPGPSVIRPVPGGLALVSCPHGGAIRIAGSIAGNLSSLLNSAAGDGVALCGWGYRSPDRQVQLRRQHCGPSHYAIYQMPSWQCSPPTARPGFSMHEQGLAVDFTCSGGGAIGSRSNPCYRWLAGHASRHGLYNLPSEPWHWSVNGN